MLLRGYGFPHNSWELHIFEASLSDETYFGDSVPFAAQLCRIGSVAQLAYRAV